MKNDPNTSVVYVCIQPFQIGSQRLLCTWQTFFHEVRFRFVGMYLHCGACDCVLSLLCAGRGSGYWTWRKTGGCGSVKTNRRPRSPHPPCSRHCCSWSSCLYGPCRAKTQRETHTEIWFIHLCLCKEHNEGHRSPLTERCYISVLAYVTNCCRLPSK